MNKKVLITGGAGFIGSNIAVKLLQMGFQVTILDTLSPQIHGKDPYNNSYIFKTIKTSKAHFIKGSVTNREDWKTALNGQDMVIHLAAETGTGQSMYQIEKYNKVNVIGTAILLDILTNEPHNKKKSLWPPVGQFMGKVSIIAQYTATYIPRQELNQIWQKKILNVNVPSVMDQ